MTPVIGMTCFAIILLSWFGGVRYFRGIPAGLIAIAVGTTIAWGSNAFGLNYGGMSFANLQVLLQQLRLLLPAPGLRPRLLGLSDFSA